MSSSRPPYMFGKWKPGDDDPCSSTPEEQSPLVGGTSHLLRAERERASFSIESLTHYIDDGEENTKRRRWIWSESYGHDNSSNYFLTREEIVAQHCDRFIEIHKKYTGSYVPKGRDVMWMGAAARNNGAFALHYGAFVPTIVSQGTPEQVAEWLPPAYTMKIVGCLAQTELGHGSNVRALQTTARYDASTQEFVINTPTLRAIKWWPGGMGKTSTHAALYAQLLIDGVEHGFHVFLFQLRDEHHRPLPGIEVGELGPKIGDNFTETGYLRIQNVRIPRTWMMMKNQEVTPEGKYIRKAKKAGAKLQYSTMLTIRAAMVMGAGYRLAQGVTIATRYSCVRQQGFSSDGVDPPNTRLSPEHSVLDYQNQQLRIFQQLGMCYAFIFTGKYLTSKFEKIRSAFTGSPDQADLTDLPEMHATSAGLKALTTYAAAAGLEECRKCCGGHGVLLASGIAQLALDYVTYVTAEGDRIILELQCARYLMKVLEQAKRMQPLPSMCAYLAPAAGDSYIIGGDAGGGPAMATCSARSFEAFTTLAVLREAFAHRAMVAVLRAGNRLRRERARDGVSPKDAWNACAVDLVQATRAHCHQVVFQCFSSEASRAPDAATRDALEALCALHGCLHMQHHLGDWMGYISTHQAEMLRTAVRHLLAKTRDNAVALTDAFEFPDNVLNSALGRHDGRVYESLYAAAKHSPMNSTDPFGGYRFLESTLDKEFIRKHAAMVRHDGPSSRL